MSERISVVLVEGLPGSGKTTTSEQIASVYVQRGESCVWVREEAKDHPYVGPDVRRQHRQTDYDDICLAEWARLVERPVESPRLVLEGCAMQSTVRFMFEQEWPTDRIERYWKRFMECISEVRAALVYLTHPKPEMFLRDHTVQVRADSWPNIARHVEQSPAGRALSDAGFDAPIEFWVRYRHLCDALVAEATLPVLTVDTGNGWEAASSRVVQWLDSIDA
jgi:hypothetical protein